MFENKIIYNFVKFVAAKKVKKTRLYRNGVICGTAYPLLVDIAFIQIHTHMTIYTNVKFHVNAISFMGEPEQCSPPV
jgi:hypothetical protein